MSLSRNLITLTVAAITLPALRAAPHCPGNVASLNLRVVRSSLIVVPVLVNHSGPFDFIVDTGAQVSTVDISLAADLRLREEGKTGVSGAATQLRSAYAYLDQLQVGTHSIPNTLAVIQDLVQLKSADPRIRGILGSNFLQHFDMLIDNRGHILCLDDSDTLARAVKGEHVPFAQPHGSQQDLPFTQPLIVAARLSAGDASPVLLRLDSGSNAPLLYAVDGRVARRSKGDLSILKRVANGAEQSFAILPTQDIRIGTHSIRQVSFVMPMNSIGVGATPREDGLLPTMAFQRVFISPVAGYAALDPW